ncbi:MAG: glutathione S-transferase family protein [Oleispira sp.]|jgi:glutathione S-transferase|nr:glutathione S-transferase family protein [Oleispira sp.]
MKLYGSYTSPFVRHCRIALLEGQAHGTLECEFIETDIVSSGKLSPTKKVPFLIDEKQDANTGNDIELTDSASILMYLREQSGEKFFNDAQDFNLFCNVNTILDASVNLFFLELKDNILPKEGSYLERHQERVLSALSYFNESQYSLQAPFTDGELRLACFLDWGLFRKRISLEGLDNLQALLKAARSYDVFAKTAPPEGA